MRCVNISIYFNFILFSFIMSTYSLSLYLCDSNVKQLVLPARQLTSQEGYDIPCLNRHGNNYMNLSKYTSKCIVFTLVSCVTTQKATRLETFGNPIKTC